MHRKLFPLLGLATICFVACADSGESTTSNDGADDQASGSEVIAQKAVAGVGKQGQKLNQHSDAQKIISGPAAALINFKQKAVLEFSIPQALQLFKASEGRMPKSHEEFMQKIVDANRLQLPTLPDGAVYRFNTEKGELWVYPEDEAP